MEFTFNQLSTKDNTPITMSFTNGIVFGSDITVDVASTAFGTTNGIATLDSSGRIPLSQMPKGNVTSINSKTGAVKLYATDLLGNGTANYVLTSNGSSKPSWKSINTIAATLANSIAATLAVLSKSATTTAMIYAVTLPTTAKTSSNISCFKIPVEKVPDSLKTSITLDLSSATNATTTAYYIDADKMFKKQVTIDILYTTYKEKGDTYEVRNLATNQTVAGGCSNLYTDKISGMIRNVPYQLYTDNNFEQHGNGVSQSSSINSVVYIDLQRPLENSYACTNATAKTSSSTIQIDTHRELCVTSYKVYFTMNN